MMERRMLVRRLFRRSSAPALEAASDVPEFGPFACPICDAPMRIDASPVPEEFAAIGIEEHDLDCAGCGMLARRLFHPSVGYDAELVR